MIFWGYCYKTVALRSVLGKDQGTPDTSRDSSDVKTVIGRIPNLSCTVQFSGVYMVHIRLIRQSAKPGGTEQTGVFPNMCVETLVPRAAVFE